MMCRLLAALLVGLAASPVAAVAQPALYMEQAAAPAQPGEIALATGRTPGTPPESWFRQNGYLQVRNVSEASLVAFLPPAHLATGEAVIVAPGGGFLALAIENEGYAVARALAEHGIAAFVLKYRLLPTPASLDAYREGAIALRSGGKATFGPPQDTPAPALRDAAAALEYVRAHANGYGVDPAKVGMMGFSAGGFLTLSAALQLPAGERPSFIAPIYPRMAAREVPADAPPMFVALADDDFLFADGSLGLITSWHRARRPVELHLYQAGGHGFGLGRQATTTDQWFPAFLRWMDHNRTPAAQRAASKD